jgi:hypothetical protein
MGTIQSIQPRIRLIRSFDETSHSYLGYAIKIDGSIDGNEQVFSVGIGKAANEKHRFKVNDRISGECVPVADERLEPVEYYKVSKLRKLSEGDGIEKGPPWETVPPALDIYRSRGHRRLAARTYETKCTTCIWGCRMPVEIIIDNWNPSKKKYRVETFCYGPLSCKLYKPGPNRKVEGRNGMVYVEEDGVDEDRTSHREPDE